MSEACSKCLELEARLSRVEGLLGLDELEAGGASVADRLGATECALDELGESVETIGEVLSEAITPPAVLPHRPRGYNDPEEH